VEGPCATLRKKAATDMLEKLIILGLICIIGILGIVIEVLWGKLQRARAHADSWKLAVEHLEKERARW
jgi:hypothetical protein